MIPGGVEAVSIVDIDVRPFHLETEDIALVSAERIDKGDKFDVIIRRLLKCSRQKRKEARCQNEGTQPQDIVLYNRGFLN